VRQAAEEARELLDSPSDDDEMLEDSREEAVEDAALSARELIIRTTFK
jgi:hypothetical protein